MNSYMSSNGIINIVQGDNLSFNFKINLGTKLYPEYYNLTYGDNLYFSVCEYNQEFEEGVIRKMFDIASLNEDGSITIEIDNTDTLNLEKGTYYYSIKLRKFDKIENEEIKYKFYTLINKTKINIL